MPIAKKRDTSIVPNIVCFCSVSNIYLFVDYKYRQFSLLQLEYDPPSSSLEALLTERDPPSPTNTASLHEEPLVHTFTDFQSYIYKFNSLHTAGRYIGPTGRTLMAKNRPTCDMLAHAHLIQVHTQWHVHTGTVPV